jgi:hypothetical protein
MPSYTGGMSEIKGADIQNFVDHWLSCPVNGYLGSPYGQDLPALLQRPQADGAADEFLDKLREDIPIINALPEGSTNLYGVQTAPDRLDLVIEVAGRTFTVSQ